jgi:serine/threonine-protein kinase HipA
MMTSDRAFVWVWLPGRNEPVVAGRVDAVDSELQFTYGRSYLARPDAIALQPDGLPLEAGTQRPPVGFDAHGVIRDGAPDAWGMQVLLRRLLRTGALDTNELPLLTYLLESGSDRIGALDFQESATDYVPRATTGTLDELVTAGERLATGAPFSPEIDDALTYGSAVGGARPKALITDGPTELIAKFSVSTDSYPWMQAEAVGMTLAGRCGVEVAPTRFTRSAGRDVLLVERFDRPGGGTRRMVLSGLTLLGLHEMAVRHGSYVGLAELIRLRFTDPRATLRELFTRIAVNILIGNNDDHPRNTAAFWDGALLTLTPAYDICPQPRSTGETNQGMTYGPSGMARARLADLQEAAVIYQLSPREAAKIVERCTDVVRADFEPVCDEIGVSGATRDLLWERSIANPSVFYPST